LNTNKKLWIALIVVFCLASATGIASASIDDITTPYDGEILTSATIDLSFDYTGSTSCYWSYLYPENNNTIPCGGAKIRLPRVDGVYNITIGDNTGSIQSVAITLEYPSGYVIVFFSFLFIVIIATLTGLLLMSIFKAISLDMDGKDLTLNVSAFFALLAIYLLSLEYLGNPAISSITLTIVEIGGITNLFIPLIAYFVTYFKKRMEFKQDG